MKVGVACRYKFKEQDARSAVYSNTLVEILTGTESKGTQPGDGKGTLASPYKLRGINEWIFCANDKGKAEPTYFEIGGRLIAQWGSGGGMFVNYCTDVTAYKSDLASKCSGGDYEAFIDGIGEDFKNLDAQSGINPKLPSYTRKGLRVKDMDDIAAVLLCRKLIDGYDNCGGCDELASSLASLLLGEGRRSRITFVITLMLLDLVETKTTYGTGGAKTYTWKSMLMYNTDKIPGRGSGKEDWGKHPMVGEGSKAFGDVGNVLDYKGVNPVRNKSLAIMSVWLAHYLQKKFPTYKYFLLSEGASSMAHNPTKQVIEHKGDFANKALRKECAAAVSERYTNSAVMIGGTTVTYEDLKGDPV